MKNKTKYIYKFAITSPVVFYLIQLLAGQAELNIKSALIIFISCTVGILLGLIYAELLSSRITKYYRVITFLIGVCLSFVMIATVGYELYVTFSITPISFIIFAAFYKQNILDKIL